MNKILFPLLTLSALALLAPGCATHEGAYLPVNTTKYNQENTANMVDMDPGAQRSVTCSGIQQRILPDGRIEVNANIRNRENRSIEVQINCVFKDEQYFSTGDETPFRTIILTENETQGVSFQSSNNKAKTYTIRVRQAR
jgi:hypothetical protein